MSGADWLFAGSAKKLIRSKLKTHNEVTLFIKSSFLLDFNCKNAQSKVKTYFFDIYDGSVKRFGAFIELSLYKKERRKNSND